MRLVSFLALAGFAMSFAFTVIAKERDNLLWNALAGIMLLFLMILVVALALRDERGH